METLSKIVAACQHSITLFAILLHKVHLNLFMAQKKNKKKRQTNGKGSYLINIRDFSNSIEGKKEHPNILKLQILTVEAKHA